MDHQTETPAPPAAEPLALVKRSQFDQLRELAAYLNDLDTVANALCKATILPPTLQTPANLKLALLQGMSMGFDVVQTIRASFVVQSKKGGARVGYFVESLVALVRSSPKCRFFRVDVATGDKCVVTCARTDEDEALVHTFELTMEQAVKQRLNVEWENDGGQWVAKEKFTWKTAPADMLRNRCCGRAVKSVFQDVTYGMSTPDEIDDQNAADAMEIATKVGFAPIPVQSPPRAAAASSTPASSAAATPPAPDIVDAELVQDDAGAEGSGDPAWDQLLHAIAQLTKDSGMLESIPPEVIAAWDERLTAAKTKRDLNALAPWIGEANRRASQSKACAEVGAHFTKTFNEQNAKLREQERAAKQAGGAA